MYNTWYQERVGIIDWKRGIEVKKIIALIFAVTLMGSLIVGCNGTETYTDPEQTISVNAGDEFIITLDSNPTTGYDWVENHDNSMLSLVYDKYKPDEVPAGLVGSGGTQYYRFKALKTGETEITLIYKQSWGTEADTTKVFNIEIK
jgi:inhibitor of cysteine peptidase